DCPSSCVTATATPYTYTLSLHDALPILLPNGKILALGGSTNDEDAASASLRADLYDPNTNTFSSAGANVYARLYHSGSVLQLARSEEHTSELQSLAYLVCRLLLEKKNQK